MDQPGKVWREKTDQVKSIFTEALLEMIRKEICSLREEGGKIGKHTLRGLHSMQVMLEQAFKVILLP